METRWKRFKYLVLLSILVFEDSCKELVKSDYTS